MIKKNIGYKQISAVYIGAVVGAGFASGQEIMQFFSMYGYKGLLGAIFSSILFIFFGYIILTLSNKLGTNSYDDLIKISCGKNIGKIIDIIITIFLFLGLAAMIAGSGAIFVEYFSTSYNAGTFFMAMLTLITVFFGIKGVINSLSSIVPFLLISMLIISLLIILKDSLTAIDINAIKDSTKLWFISSVNYVSYNLIIAFAVLTPLGAKAKSDKDIILGAIYGGIGLGMGLIFIYFAVLTDLWYLRNCEIPMIYLANRISPLSELVYSIVLFLGIYSTGVGNLYGFVTRISKTQKQRKLILISSSFGALFLSQLGFSNMVKYLYPLIGYVGLLLLICLLKIWIQAYKKRF